MDKRYQVFVSSTYEDLRTERQEVMHALLELDCIPSGMELFPAANEDQWSLIKKVIDECDYYIVISAGRYGSIGPKGQSYTEMEYRYATDANKPAIAFLYRDPLQLTAAKVEQTDEGKIKLRSFRELLEKKMCKHWTSAGELGSVVSRSLIRLMKTNPTIGWVRADQATDTIAAGEILSLRKKIEELESRLLEVRAKAPAGSEKLAQGNEFYKLSFSYTTSDESDEDWLWDDEFQVSWDQIFYQIGPLLIDEASDFDLGRALNENVRLWSRANRKTQERLEGQKRFRNFKVTDNDFHTIKVQLRALGLITKSQKPRSLKDTRTYWTLTPFGDQHLTTLRAIPTQSELRESHVIDDQTREDDSISAPNSEAKA